ncbi:hypothetical protein LguiA_030628 [Lonicera macranthoides]
MDVGGIQLASELECKYANTENEANNGASFLTTIVILSASIFATKSFKKDDLVEQVCKTITDLSLCLSALQSNPRSSSSDMKGLAHIVLEVSLCKGSGNFSQVKKLVQNATDPIIKQCLDLCMKQYDLLIDNVNKAIHSLESNSFRDTNLHAVKPTQDIFPGTTFQIVNKKNSRIRKFLQGWIFLRIFHLSVGQLLPDTHSPIDRATRTNPQAREAINRRTTNTHPREGNIHQYDNITGGYHRTIEESIVIQNCRDPNLQLQSSILPGHANGITNIFVGFVTNSAILSTITSIRLATIKENHNSFVPQCKVISEGEPPTLTDYVNRVEGEPPNLTDYVNRVEGEPDL